MTLHESALWQNLREEIPVCQSHAYLNSAGASPTSARTHRTILDYLELERTLGGYHAALGKEQDILKFYTNARKLLNAKHNTISFCENATRAWAHAFYALPLRRGDRVITHTSEYSSNLIAMQHRAERDGIIIDVVPSLSDGTVDTHALENLITTHTKVVAITHIAMHLGLVNPIETLGKMCKQYNLIFMVDACQSVGQRSIDVESINCDVLTATGRKFLRGPRGTGLLYIHPRRLDSMQPAFIDNLSAQWQADGHFTLQEDHRRFESWERNVAAMLGLGTAIEHLLEIGVNRVETQIQKLGSQLENELTSAGFACYEHNEEIKGTVKSGIVTLNNRDSSPFGNTTAALRVNELSQSLHHHRIQHSVVRRSQAFPYFKQQLDRPEHQRARLDDGIVRLSVHAFNNSDDIHRVITCLQKIRRDFPTQE